ncbi:hypothetical protein UFOVP1393_23 [uncultured Caudovirales phage]|uniref:Uncharacterized protein n=1 Tax=uncultured Caudovirales phage TaxID=2100421 RepID=A0A6J5S6J8_9CAUD|nr:hypothetical protein UFOVP1393_23 [uncultured Caudovirales phage]
MKKTDSLFKQLHDANEEIKKLKKEIEVLTWRVNEINFIVDNPDFDMRSNEFKIWEIINEVRD